VAGLDLREDRVHRRARDVRAAPRLAPGQRVHGVLHRERHQRVPGGMERHLVDPMPKRSNAVELGLVAVRLAAERERLRAAHRGRVRAHARRRPFGALAREPLAERAIGVEQVHVRERRRLVLHRVRGVHASSVRLAPGAVKANARRYVPARAEVEIDRRARGGAARRRLGVQRRRRWWRWPRR
jgi:hypothetical protein